MATYYVTASGSGGSGTQEDPWCGRAGFQTALDTAAAGDTVIARGTFQLDAVLDVDTNSADVSLGQKIHIIGIAGESTWVPDGTKCVLDAQGSEAHCVNVPASSAIGPNGYVWENFDFRRATGANVINNHASLSAANWVFLNCDSREAGGAGFNCYSSRGFDSAQFIRCRAWSNGAGGFANAFQGQVVFGCTALHNTGAGYSGSSLVAIACISHGNSQYGFSVGQRGVVWASVADGNGLDGILSTTGPALTAFTRITNNGRYGLNVDTGLVSAIYNFYSGNTSGATNGSVILSQLAGAETSITSGSASYADAANHEFVLLLGAGGLRTAMDLLGGNVLRASPGLPTWPAAWPLNRGA